MKTRMGFVSNSSSASFIITWKLDDDMFADLEPHWSAKDRAIDLLMGTYSFKEKQGKLVLDENSIGCSRDKKIFKEILDSTEELSPNKFETTFWTCMFNGPADFGDASGAFCAAWIIENRKFRDNYWARVEMTQARIEHD